MRAIVCVVVMGLVVGCEDPGAKVESAVVEAPSKEARAPEGADTAPAKAGAQLSITPENTKIAFVGAKVTQSHDGGFTKFAGMVDLREPIEASTVEVTIDTTSLYADRDKLTNHLKSPDFFDVAKYPSAKFRSAKITKTDTGHTITGDLTLHGVTKSITFPATITKGADGGVSSSAEFAINRQDFGISYPGMPDDLIRDKVVIKLDLKLPPQS